MATVKYIEREEPGAEESAWTKWWDRNKPQSRGAETLKFVDHLSVDERVALSELRRLGEVGELDAKATTFEELAKSMRGKANARRMIDTYPHLFPPDVAPPPTVMSLVIMVLCALTLIAIVALASLQYRAPRPTLPAGSAAQEAPHALPEPTKVEARSRKGREAR